MRLDPKLTAEALILHVTEPRIDAACAIAFKDAAAEAVARHPGLRVILDLAEVGFVDSSGLGAVVAIHKLLAPDRGLELARLRPPVERVFRLTRMDRVFPLHTHLPHEARNAV